MLRGTSKQVRPHREVTLVKRLMKTVITEGCRGKCYGHGKYSARGIIPPPWVGSNFCAEKSLLTWLKQGVCRRKEALLGLTEGLESLAQLIF